MGLFDKMKNMASQAKESAMQFAEENKLDEKMKEATDSVKKACNDSMNSISEYRAEVKALSEPLEGAIVRYEFTYVGGLADIPKAKTGAWGMNVMPDRFAFKVTITTKDWLYDLDIPYDDISDIRIEKRTISTGEMLLGAGNDPNQQQENVIVIEYVDANKQKATLRIEMLTGVTIYNQAAKCKDLMDILRRENILDKIKNKSASGSPSNSGGDIIEQIKKLSDLKEAGILSEEEFQAKKSELLAKL